jgi:hypothetical protein
MSNGLEKRLSRLEQQVANRAKSRICNCRGETNYHNANCLDALLKRMPRVCPRHSFRDLGFLMYVPRHFPLISEDNQFCPCPPDPWRSFILSEGPHTQEAKMVAARASLKIPLPDRSSSLDSDLRAQVLKSKYWKAREQWIEKTGRQLPSRDELAKLPRERMSEWLNEAKKNVSLAFEHEISEGWIKDYESPSFLDRFGVFIQEKCMRQVPERRDLSQDSTPVSTKPGNVEELQESLVR